MNADKAKKCISIAGMVIYCPSKQAAALARLAHRLADDGGTIQAHDMLRLTTEPTRHTCTSLDNYLASIGCTVEG